MDTTAVNRWAEGLITERLLTILDLGSVWVWEPESRETPPTVTVCVNNPNAALIVREALPNLIRVVGNATITTELTTVANLNTLPRAKDMPPHADMTMVWPTRRRR